MNVNLFPFIDYRLKTMHIQNLQIKHMFLDFLIQIFEPFVLSLNYKPRLKEKINLFFFFEIKFFLNYGYDNLIKRLVLSDGDDLRLYFYIISSTICEVRI